jgi:tetratricopeptide (TPR) repeat protein/tRNA A-37 threonylcarbamoyl transferase component Bud32
MIGETVSHYRILERLGEGGMGEVYLAEDLKLKRKAAIKFIAADLTRDAVRRERFVQEATLAASIDHPHVAAIYDIDRAGDRTFIAMEYVRGQTLRGLLGHGSLPLRRVLDLAIQIADALAKVHHYGVTHRDLKPENVIVSEDGYAKVIDFGLAKLTERIGAPATAETATNLQVRTADGLVLGTVAYMSPEQARGETVDARSDIFSFGVLLHELLTGTAPFRRGSTAETLSAILTATPPAPSVADAGVSPELQRIVRKCLVKDADGRYQSMREVVVDLRGVRDALASGTHSTAIAAQPAPFRIGARTWIGVAIAAAILVGIAAWLWTRGSNPPAAGRAAGAGDARPAIAIMSFDNVGGAADTAWLSAGLPSMLVTGLAQNPEVEVITADRLNEAARQVGQTQFSAVDPGTRLEVVRRTGATIVVNGTIIRAGDELRIDARVEDLASGRVVLADTVRGSDPLAMADDLAARIRRGLNVRTTDAARPVAELLYDERMTHLSEAARHLDRLSERDALIVQAAVADSRQRWDEALELFERLVARYPDTVDGYSGAAALYRGRGDSARAVELVQRGVNAVPTAGALYNVLGYMYLADGRPREAIRAFETYVKLRPHEPNALDSLAEGQLAGGDLSLATETATRAQAAGHAGSRTTLAWIHAVQGRYDEALAAFSPTTVAGVYAMTRVGRYRDAEAALSRGLTLPAAPPAVAAAITDVLRGTFALERGDCRTALERFGAAGKAAPTPPGTATAAVDLLLGTCEARTGQLAAARARLAQRRNDLSASAPDIRWWARQLEGEIALVAGDPAAAATVFEGALPAQKMSFNRSGPGLLVTLLSNSLVLRDGLARARIAQGRLDDAIAVYRRLLVTDRDSKYTAFYEPRYVLAIARLLEKTGKKDEARAEYKRFLDFWKNADAELPELAEARARLRSL